MYHIDKESFTRISGDRMMDMEGIKKLLSEVGRIRAKVESYNQASGRCFNIFSIANIATDEVKICRVLHALLNPKGPHYQGAEFLKLFVEKVLRPNRSFTEDEYKSAEVSREYSTDEGRRIDLFLQLGGKNIPIEAKIYAGDQNEQCECYAKYASEGMSVYYLTPDGHEPENFSRGKLPAEKLELRSFAGDILPWLDECLRLPAVIRIAPIREVLLQFQDTIREFTGTMEDDMKNSVLKMVAEYKNISAAIDISRALEAAHANMRIKIFETLDKKIETKCDLIRFVQANDYTKKGMKSYPGISYKLDADKAESCCLRVEIDNSSKIFCGLCMANDEQIIKGEAAENEKLKAEIFNGEWKSTAWWIAWKYPVFSKIPTPNFSQYNDGYCALYEAEIFDSFIEDVMKLVDNLIETVNKSGKYSIALK